MRIDSHHLPTLVEHQYLIVRSLGVGSRAEVLLGCRNPDEEDALQSPSELIALKQLHERLHSDRLLVERFYQEAAFLRSLPPNANLVAVQDAGCWNERHTMVLDYVRGVTLRQFLDAYAASISPAIAFEIIYQLAGVLQFLQPYGPKQGFVHGDLSPTNILIDQSGSIRLIDFDVAIEIQDDPQQTAMGTLPYISPEQCEERPLDLRSDIFVLGTLLWEMLRGKCPYPRFDPAHAMLMIAEEQIAAPFAHHSDPQIALAQRIWQQLHALQRASRYTTFSALLHDIRSLALREDGATRRLLAEQIAHMTRKAEATG